MAWSKRILTMSLRLSCLALVLIVPAAGAGPQAKYARPELLIEAGDLLKPQVARKFRILDARPAPKYEAGHIPGAFWVNHNVWAKAFNSDPSPEGWGKRIAALDIGSTDRPVVVYADDARAAARIWWILRYWGLQNVRLLNGGWQVWQEAGGKEEKGIREGAAGMLKVTAHPERLATMKQLLANLKDRRLSVLDARSQGEFCGDVKHAKRGGSIPEAVHLEWSDVLEAKSRRFKSAASLAKLFKDAGVDFTKPQVTFCQSGGRAAALAFALELMGAKEVRNYYRSWSEWGNVEDTPVVVPKKK
jgi:thiosulfate/3-mercaptopyruvate sulfurtransferase